MNTSLRFDLYGRFELELRREGQDWVVYRVGNGLRRRDSLVVPAELEASELAGYLDDIFHELAGPGQQVRPLR